MKSKKKLWLKIISSIVGAILVLVLGIAAYLSISIRNAFRDIDTETVTDTPLKIDTYGDPQNPSMLMIHGMYMDGSSLEAEITELKQDYYLIVPTNHGSDGATETTFDSFDSECADMEDYIQKNLDGHLDYAYGISMGATTLYNLLQRNNIEIDTAILDGLYVAHQGEFAAYFTAKMMYPMQQAVSRGEDFEVPSMMKMSAEQMGYDKDNAKSMYEHTFTTTPFTYRNMLRIAYANYTYEIDPSVTIDHTKVYLWCGSREPYALQSNEIVKPQIKQYEEKVFDGYAHAELVMSHAEECVKEIRAVAK